MDTLISVSYKQFDKIRTESKKINNILYPDGILGDDFFEFAEYTEVKVGLNSSDPNAIIEIESYKDDILIHNGEEKKICCKEDNEMMLVPGCYPITIKIQNRIYQGTYKIKPSSIEWEYLLNIREYLERVVRGLSYNIYIERKNLGNLNKDKDIFILELYKFIKENYIKLINNMNAIVDHPITDVYKEYDFKNYSIIQDKKSQRWLSKRGYTNNVMSMTNIYWEKHSRLNYNTSENLMVKHVINHIFNILNEAYCIYLNDKNNSEFKKKESLNKFNDKNDELNIIKSDPNKKKIKKTLKFQLDLLDAEVKNYNNKIQIISGDLNGINKIKSFIYYYKNETWFKNIEEVRICKATMRLFRNKYYASIYNFYKELYNKDTIGRHKNIFPYKKTSKLFEIYSYILIKEILEELGFEWTNGWLKDIKNILAYNGDLKSSEKIVLIKEPYKIELVYDKEIIHVRDAKKSGVSQIIYTGTSQSTKPDILLNLYKEEKFKGSFIAEIKCRKKKYIYNKNQDNDVMSQIQDYNKFEYYNSMGNEPPVSDAIKKIVVIYPKQEGKCKFKDDLYGFSFIQVSPTDLDEKPYGYNELKEEICEFLGDEIVNNSSFTEI